MGKAWEHLPHEWRLVDARWTWGGGDLPIYHLMCNGRYRPVKSILWTSYMGSWLSLECSMMKSSTLFERGPSRTSPCPPCVHQTSFMWQVFPSLPCFSCAFASVYYTEHKPKSKIRGSPGNEAIFFVCFAQTTACIGVAWSSFSHHFCALLNSVFWMGWNWVNKWFETMNLVCLALLEILWACFPTWCICKYSGTIRTVYEKRLLVDN